MLVRRLYLLLNLFLIFGMISLFAGYLGGHLKQSAVAQNIMNRIAAIVYMALAVKLISAEM